MNPSATALALVSVNNRPKSPVRFRAATEAKGTRWVNVVLGNVKQAISSSYHAMRQTKYARRLGAAAYRLNRRFRLAELLP